MNKTDKLKKITDENIELIKENKKLKKQKGYDVKEQVDILMSINEEMEDIKRRMVFLEKYKKKQFIKYKIKMFYYNLLKFFVR